LLHNNAPSHKAASVCKFFTQKFIIPLAPPYSPDFSPPYYFIFPKLKINLKELQFADVFEIEETVIDELQKVQKVKFSAAFQKLYDRAKTFTYPNGAYFKYKSSMFSIFKKTQSYNLWTALCMAFPLKKLVGECAAILLHTHIASLVSIRQISSPLIFRIITYYTHTVSILA
jgi:ACT domain-containing protein